MSLKNTLLLVGFLLVAVNVGVLKNPFAADPMPSSEHASGVVLYATAWCGYCKKTRDLLNKEGIAFVEFDIEKSRAARDEYDRLKGRGVPLLVIHGEVVRGFDPATIVRLASRQ